MAHVSTTLKRKFLRAAHNGKTKKMVDLLNTANNEHDYQYNKRIVYFKAIINFLCVKQVV